MLQNAVMRYREQHGQGIERLEDLVTRGLLDALPKTRWDMDSASMRRAGRD
jgi:hypothetical protein